MFEDINFLLNASKTCLGIAAVFFVSAVAIFFLFGIRDVLLIETGRAKQKTVQEMNERNLRTGKLRSEEAAFTGETDKGKNGRAKPFGKPSRSSGSETAAFGGRTFGSGGDEADSAGLRGGHTVRASQETMPLASGPPGGFQFTVTQRTIVIHTDEHIPA